MQYIDIIFKQRADNRANENERAQGAYGIGPIHDPAALQEAVAEGLRRVDAGDVVVIDVRIAPGYATNLSGETPKGG